MELPSATRAGAPGTDLIQPIHDAVDVHDVTGGAGFHSYPTYPMVFLSMAGFESSNIKLLVDAQATKAAIRDAIISWLDSLEDENTLVVIFFSGHGMRAPDDNPPEEADGYDEFIVPYDIGCINCGTQQVIWIPETAIRDDEFDNWLSQLESQRIVVILDSCFAGGMVSSAGVTARGLPSLAALNGKESPLQVGDGFAQDINKPGRVVLMASQETQGSWEFSALKNGAFTYYLVEALHSPAADTNSNGFVSAEEAYAYLAPKVDNYVYEHAKDKNGQIHVYHQNPQLYDGISGQVDLTRPIVTTSCPFFDGQSGIDALDIRQGEMRCAY
jgi:hypothetical protein